MFCLLWCYTSICFQFIANFNKNVVLPLRVISGDCRLKKNFWLPNSKFWSSEMSSFFQPTKMYDGNQEGTIFNSFSFHHIVVFSRLQNLRKTKHLLSTVKSEGDWVYS